MFHGHLLEIIFIKEEIKYLNHQLKDIKTNNHHHHHHHYYHQHFHQVVHVFKVLLQ